MSHKLFIASLWLLSLAGLFALTTTALAAPQYHPNEGPTLPPPASTITQSEFSPDPLSPPLEYVRTAGMQVFSTEFRKNILCQAKSKYISAASEITDGDPAIDGFGDGCHENTTDPTRHSGNAGRPALQNNGTFLRANGLGAQSCVDCHFEDSSRAIPFTMAVGGHGGLITTEFIFDPQTAMNGENATIDVDDQYRPGDPREFAEFNGRIVNPPDLFGDGGVQLVGEEITTKLHSERYTARMNPGMRVSLVYTSAPPSSATVSFGEILCGTSGSPTPVPVSSCDTSDVKGVNSDLVVRPFGRKGQFSTVRAFADNAFEFHSGIQPAKIESNTIPDPDGDSVIGELNSAQLSALAIFLATQKPPIKTLAIGGAGSQAALGKQLFKQIGCTSCHIPEIDTTKHDLTFRLPPSQTSPAPVAFSQSPNPPYYKVDLSQRGFKLTPNGNGIEVKTYSDFKRHNMGPRLCENATFNDRAPQIKAEGAITGPDASNYNCMFITAKLWGVFDSAPYMHDGRALVLSNAIRLHGGEAEDERNYFLALKRPQQDDILVFLSTLSNPPHPNSDVVPNPR